MQRLPRTPRLMADRAATAEAQAPPWLHRVAGALAGLGAWRALAMALALGALAAGALPPLHALPLLWIAFPGLL
jgi:hypothetical protein